MKTPSAVSYAPGCGCRVHCDLEAKQGARWTMKWCPLHQAAPKLLTACKEAKKYLEPDLVEPGRTVFWRLVDSIHVAEGKRVDVR